MTYKIHAYTHGNYTSHFCISRSNEHRTEYWNYRDNTWMYDAIRAWHKDKEFLVDEFNGRNDNQFGDVEPEILW